LGALNFVLFQRKDGENGKKTKTGEKKGEKGKKKN
jgi:hypothetical protein